MKRFITLLALFSSIPLAANAKPISIAKDSGQVEFLAVGKPSMLKIRGKSTGPSGSLDLENGLVSGSLTVALSGLDSGIEMRDRHMKERYLETGKYPDAVLLLTGFALPAGFEGEKDFQAQLSLHGQQKPVSGKARLKNKANTIAVEAKFNLLLGDFNIEIPSYAGIKIADSVEVNVAFEVNK